MNWLILTVMFKLEELVILSILSIVMEIFKKDRSDLFYYFISMSSYSRVPIPIFSPCSKQDFQFVSGDTSVK